MKHLVSTWLRATVSPTYAAAWFHFLTPCLRRVR